MGTRAKPKRHLLLRDHRSACGLPQPRFYSNVPDEVTCLACQRSVQMADAIVAYTNRHH